MGKIVKTTDKNGQITYPVTLDEAVVCSDGNQKKTLKQKLKEFHNITPLAVRTYTGLYYGANSTSNGYFSPICVKPKDKTKVIGEYHLKYKVSTTCSSYSTYANYSIIDIWFNRTGTVNCYKIWNWRVGSYLHYYANVVRGGTNAIFENYGSLVGIGIVSGNNYSSASYKRTCVFEVLEVSDDLEWTIVDSCDSLPQYTNTQWYTDVVAAGATVTNDTYNAVDVGFQESGDSNTYDRYYIGANSIKVSDNFKLMNTSLIGFDSNGNIFSLGQYGSSSDVTSRYTGVSKGNWVSGTAYAIGDYVYYATNGIYYRCIKAHTSSSSIIPTNTTYWQVYREYNHEGIDYKRGMYYGGTAYARGTVVTSTSIYPSISGIDFRYTFNCVASNSTANTLGIEMGKLVYVRGYVKDGLFYIVPTTETYSSNPYFKCWTQNPVDENIVVEGVTYKACYWLIGGAYYNSSYTTRGYQVNLFPENTMFTFVNGQMVEYDHYLVGNKQDVISDLATIRSGASAGATAVQPSAISDMETKTHASATYQPKGSYLVASDIANKVDKVSGKGLSTNDYTTTEKNKLSGIAAGAEVNVQSDWNVTDTSSDAYIKNKPTIPSAVTESTVSGWGFTKNTGTYSKPSGGIPKTDLSSAVQASLNKADAAGTYSLPANGIPKSDLDSSVQSSLAKADTALQSHQDISGKAEKTEAVHSVEESSALAPTLSDSILTSIANKADKLYVDGLIGNIGTLLESLL